MLHGWFLDAAPFFAGSLPEEVCVEPLNDCLEPLYERLAEMPLVRSVALLVLTATRQAGSRTCAPQRLSRY